jgi:hypothetical protein
MLIESYTFCNTSDQERLRIPRAQLVTARHGLRRTGVHSNGQARRLLRFDLQRRSHYTEHYGAGVRRTLHFRHLPYAT